MRAMRLRYAAIGLLTYVQSIAMVITASSSSSRSSTSDGSRSSSTSATTACRSAQQGSVADFSDLPSRTVQAQIVFVGRATRVRPVDNAVRYRVRFSVSEFYKGESLLPEIPRRQPNISEPTVDVIVTSLQVRRPTGSSESSSSSSSSVSATAACIPAVGARYIVFTAIPLSSANRRGGNSSSTLVLEMSGIPVPYSDRTAKTVKENSCKKCVRRPRVIMNSSEVTLIAGQRLRLECRGTGKPQPLITWYKDDRAATNRRIKVNENSRRSQLQISRVKVEDSGVYSCQGESVLGQSALASVNVIVRDLDPLLNAHTRPCQDQTYCMNGGTCLIMNGFEHLQHCRCTNNFGGPRCQEKLIGQAVVASERSWLSLILRRETGLS